MSRFIEIPDDGIIRFPIIENNMLIGAKCIDLSDISTCDVKPVMRGKWKWGERKEVHCSICGELIAVTFTEETYKECIKDYNYCPYCGADMR